MVICRDLKAVWRTTLSIGTRKYLLQSAYVTLIKLKSRGKSRCVHSVNYKWKTVLLFVWLLNNANKIWVLRCLLFDLLDKIERVSWLKRCKSAPMKVVNILFPNVDFNFQSIFTHLLKPYISSFYTIQEPKKGINYHFYFDCLRNAANKSKNLIIIYCTISRLQLNVLLLLLFSWTFYQYSRVD